MNIALLLLIPQIIPNNYRSDKKGLIAGKYMGLINNLYLHFFASCNYSANISKISMNSP